VSPLGIGLAIGADFQQANPCGRKGLQQGRQIGPLGNGVVLNAVGLAKLAKVEGLGRGKVGLKGWLIGGKGQ